MWKKNNSVISIILLFAILKKNADNHIDTTQIEEKPLRTV
jgi:hypothetical protein